MQCRFAFPTVQQSGISKHFVQHNLEQATVPRPSTSLFKTPGMEDVDDSEEEDGEAEAAWRTNRFEREKFLRENPLLDVRIIHMCMDTVRNK